MRYIDLILDKPLIWALFACYLIFTSWLAWLGHKKTTDIKSFALGAGDMSPAVVGVTLASSIASTATFVINPGFVYVHGVSALMHLGVAAGVGVVAGLLMMSLGFRRVGQRTKALTLPQWVGQRYRSEWMTTFFAGVNLLSLMFLVLIVGSLSIVMQTTLGLTNFESVFFIIVFVFSYIFVGGTYAHAYTNTLQGVIMTVVAAVIVFSGVKYLSGGWEAISTTLAAVNPNLVETINPTSVLYGDFFSVWVSGVIIGFALVAQPHIMVKALYVKSDADVWRYLGVCFFVSLFFTALLFVGIYAHMMGLAPEAFLDPATKVFAQDRVMTVYLVESFGPTGQAFIMVALMSAGMSTLDGILIALSSIAANDLFLNLTRKNVLKSKTPEEQAKLAHRAGQVILVLLGLSTFVLALNPPKLLGIFGMLGVYGIVAASLAPILAGIVFKRVNKYAILASSVVALTTHFGLYWWVLKAVEQKRDLRAELTQGGGMLASLLESSGPQLGLLNPSVTATCGILLSLLIAFGAGLFALVRGGSEDQDEAEGVAAPAAEPLTAAAATSPEESG